MGMIWEVMYLEWLANVVVVQERNGKWRVCVDYTDLNKACLKDSFPLPHIDAMVDATGGHEPLTFMDASSEFNQIKMHPADQENIVFITERGIYYYTAMPFGLKIAGQPTNAWKNKSFQWMPEHETTFQEPKTYLATPPKMVKLNKGEPLIVYLSVTETVVSGVLVKEIEDHQHPIYYISKSLLNAETRTAIKSQALADFVANFSPNLEPDLIKEVNQLDTQKSGQDWTLHVDGETNMRGTSLGLVLKPPQGDIIAQAGILPQDRHEARALRIKASTYTIINNTLLKKSQAGPYLRCLEPHEAKQVIEDIHDRYCGNHKGGRSLASKVLRTGYFWPTLRADCLAYSSKCEACQLHSPFIHQPFELLYSISAPWPFMKWGMDIVGKLPQAPGQKAYMLAMIDYFSKWIEADSYRWAGELPLILWADETTPKTSTGKTPYSLVYGCEAVIPAEIHVPTTRCSLNTVEEKQPLIQDNLTLAEELRDAAIIRIASYQQTVARRYNKNVNIGVFRKGNLVLRKVFPNTKDKNAGRLAPAWEGPYLTDSVVRQGTYRL
ncbi:uncharacterized protein LOC141607372 [Silene latifolia]|uniref:uncharacterized protein LOC141607372 n=1 Tax=Silene latifolia TaxID=37657 RepID=UPI003D76F53E